MNALARRLGLPDALPPAIRWASLLYLTHVLFQGKTATSEIGATFALLLVGWAVFRREATLPLHVLYYPLFLYAIASTVSSLAAPRRIHVFGESMLWWKILLFPAALTLMSEVPRVRQLAIWAHGIFLTVIACDGLLQYFVYGRRDLEHRITGTSTHVMTYSGLLLPLSLLFAILWLHERKRWMLVPAILGTFALLLTFTRSAWLAWLAAVFVVLFASRIRWLAWAVPLLIVFVILMPLPMFSRLVSIFDTRQESNLDRIRMVQAGAEMIRDYPLLGVGPANVKEVYPLYRKSDAPRFVIPHLHDNVVQIWAERGIVALAAYLLLIGLFARECLRGWRGASRPWAEAGLAVIVALTVAGVFEFNFGDTEVFYLMLDIMALVVVSMRAAQPAAEPESGATLHPEAVPAAG